MNLGGDFFGYSGLTDPAILPLLLLIIALSVFGLVTMPLGNVWSRWREVKADEYALKMSGNPQAFIKAASFTPEAHRHKTRERSPSYSNLLMIILDNNK